MRRACSFSVAFYAERLIVQPKSGFSPVAPLTRWRAQLCDSRGACTPDASTSIVLDANWRWAHNVGGSTNCYTGNAWDAALCPDGVTCAKNCAVDGADYAVRAG